MSLRSQARLLGRNLALSAGIAITMLVLALAALGFLAASVFLWAAPHWGAAAAAGGTGAALLLLAVLAGFGGCYLARRLHRNQPSLLAEVSGTLLTATRLLGFIIRQDPKKAILLSLLAGALVEYFTPEKKRD